MAQELLTLQNLSKYYTSGQSVVMGLNSISLTFRAGEFVALTGESGSGKSTLARVMAGILPYEGGEMLVEGRPTSHYDGGDWERYRAERISFISQSYDILPGCTVRRNVVSALRLTGMDKEQAASRTEEILRQVELWELRDRRAAKLSSGQKQRLSIARALAKPAPILVADEPTGNLDGENSAKVISLLAEAAKERLVILITHDFDEAEDCATRRITLRDGAVVADVALRPANEPRRTPAPARPAAGRDKKGLGVYTARLQTASRPVWSAVMLAFFALTAFAVFAFLGTFIVNLDDSSTRTYDGTAFRNGSPTRIVVARADGAEMTEEDWAALLSVDHVEGLERYGYMADFSYFYREDIDLSYHYVGLGDDTGNVSVIKREVTLSGDGLFMQTVPLLAAEGDFLTAGRLPEGPYEVVAAGDESLLGQRFPVYVQDLNHWNRTAYLLFTVEVVGVTGRGEGLYFSDQLGRSLTYCVTAEALDQYSANLVLLPYEYRSMIDERLLDPPEGVRYDLPDYYGNEPVLDFGEVTNCYPVYDSETGQPKLDENGEQEYVAVTRMEMDFLCYQNAAGSPSFSRTAATADGGSYPFLGRDAAGSHPSTYLNTLTVPEEAFDLLVGWPAGDQVSLTITDFAYTQRVLDGVRALGYSALSPYVEGSTRQDPALAAERLQTLKVCLLALAAVVLLQIVVLRAMFGLETEEFRLLADLGLDRGTARRAVMWQILAFTAGGQALALAALLLCGGLGVERVVSILRYLPLPWALLLSAVHLAAGVLAGLWAASSVRRKVYPFTGHRPDLDMGELEEEAEV
ncbi:MAG: ABC transporter ATP-binding protein [Candidatus Enterenecus sp.]